MSYKKVSLIFTKERDIDEFNEQLIMFWIKDKTVKNIKIKRFALTAPSVWGKYKYQMDADVKTDCARDYCLVAKDFNGNQKGVGVR